MKFFFDESGDFMVPRSWLSHRAAVVVGVAVSELIEVRLEAEFRAFVARLSPRERPNGEPKGRCLTPEHRREFCNLLPKYDGVSVTPVTLDLSALSGQGFSRLPERMGELLEERSALMLHERAREELRLIGRQFKNLSVPQALRLFALANCFREALHHSIIFLANRGHEASWNAVRYEIRSEERRVG